MRVEERALQVLQRSRMCVKCELLNECVPNMAKACAAAYVKGYKQGWKEHAYSSKRKARHERIEGNEDE